MKFTLLTRGEEDYMPMILTNIFTHHSLRCIYNYLKISGSELKSIQYTNNCMIQLTYTDDFLYNNILYIILYNIIYTSSKD